MKLELEGIWVSLSGKPILNNISFCVPRGSFHSVLGVSGCGKSTLLKAIAGLLPWDSGEIRLDGKGARNLPAHKRQAVIVFQDIRLFPHMSVVENVAFPLKIQGAPKTERLAAAKELLQRVQLEAYADRRPNQLSGGQQQRVALARALAAKPRLLLLDEPFSSLDENLRFDMRLLILELHREYDMTTIMVTHDKDEALSMSDTILVMENGTVMESGTPREIYETPRSLATARYFGNGAFVEGEVRDGVFHSREFTVPCGPGDGRCTLMVRHDAARAIPGEDFQVLRHMYTGGVRELLLRHAASGFSMRCQASEQPSLAVGDSVSLELRQDRLLFFP